MTRTSRKQARAIAIATNASSAAKLQWFLAAAAIAAAVYDAVGVRIKQLPVTAERVWKALQEKAAEEKSMSAAGK